MHILLEVVQAVLVAIGFVAVVIFIFWKVDRLISNRRDRVAREILAKQALINKMREACNLPLSEAALLLDEVGIYSSINANASNDLQIILPKFFWEGDVLPIARSLVTIVKDSEDQNLYQAYKEDWVWPLSQILVERAKTDPLLVVAVGMEISRCSRDIGDRLMPKIMSNRQQ